MRIREDELHEPMRRWVVDNIGLHRPIKTCAVCNLQMLGEDDYNYCPRCGARLRDVSQSTFNANLITLPHKDRLNEGVHVFFRDRWGHISVEWCPDETAADSFIEEQKKKAQEEDEHELAELEEAKATYNSYTGGARADEKLTEEEVTQMLAAWDRKTEIEKKRGWVE